MACNEMNIKEIGLVENNSGLFSIKIHKEYIPGLAGLKGYSHLIAIWCFHKSKDSKNNEKLVFEKPYKKGPEKVGVFSTRSQFRPNPLALSVVKVKDIDFINGLIKIWWIEADNGSPVLDIKPYIPGVDRVENPEVPDWCKHWPNSIEESSNFKWEEEFNF